MASTRIGLLCLLGAPVVSASGDSCTTLDGQNNHGSNLESSARYTNSYGDCCTACSQTANCKGYTWVKGNHQCWLKSAVEAPKADGDVVSGNVAAPAPTPSPPGPSPTPPSPTPPSPTGTVVERYGQLKVQGNKVVGKDGQQVRLQGMSLFWSQWMDKYWNKDVLSWLVKDWKIQIIRAAMGVDQGGYISNPSGEKAKLERVVQACIDLGIYVIIDWHLEASDAHVDQAKPFFSEMAQKYGKYPNVLFETWNEPKYVDWSTIKAYHEQVVGEIRKHSDNICILGNEQWSSNPAGAAQDPVSGENLAYTVHFYAASNQSPGRIQGALDAGHAVWATEWGTCESSGNGRVDTASSATWMSYLQEHGISSTNWAIEDKAESCAALHAGASTSGGWSDSQLTQSGQWVRNTIRASVLNSTKSNQVAKGSVMV